jgi:hypothetical protein
MMGPIVGGIHYKGNYYCDDDDDNKHRKYFRDIDDVYLICVDISSTRNVIT